MTVVDDRAALPRKVTFTMTITKDETRRISELVGEMGVGEWDELLRRIVLEIPHATTEDLAAVLDAHMFKLAQSEAETRRIAMARDIVKRAIDITGGKKITLAVASAVLAARGDVAAMGMLRGLKDAEIKHNEAEVRAAVEAHPGWRLNSDQTFECKAECPEDTPEKLLTWFGGQPGTTTRETQKDETLLEKLIAENPHISEYEIRTLWLQLATDYMAKTEMTAGKPQKQAVAVALSNVGKSNKQSKRGRRSS